MNDRQFLRMIRKGGWKRSGNLDEIIRRLVKLADRADGKVDNVVSARVGALKAEIKPGADGKLGTADDEVVIKKAAPRKRAAKKKAAPKKKPAAKK